MPPLLRRVFCRSAATAARQPSAPPPRPRAAAKSATAIPRRPTSSSPPRPAATCCQTPRRWQQLPCFLARGETKKINQTCPLLTNPPSLLSIRLHPPRGRRREGGLGQFAGQLESSRGVSPSDFARVSAQRASSSNPFALSSPACMTSARLRLNACRPSFSSQK